MAGIITANTEPSITGLLTIEQMYHKMIIDQTELGLISVSAD